jgi:hypothetical protein
MDLEQQMCCLPTSAWWTVPLMHRSLFPVPYAQVASLHLCTQTPGKPFSSSHSSCRLRSCAHFSESVQFSKTKNRLFQYCMLLTNKSERIREKKILIFLHLHHSVHIFNLPWLLDILQFALTNDGFVAKIVFLLWECSNIMIHRCIQSGISWFWQHVLNCLLCS